MILLLLLLNLETPLRMPQILLTTPLNTYQFAPLDRYEDFFLSYPFISIKNDSIYFRGSSKVLLLLDGIPIQSLNDVPFPEIEKIELLAEHSGSPYGDYDAVLNVIVKKFSSTEIHFSQSIAVFQPASTETQPSICQLAPLVFCDSAQNEEPPTKSVEVQQLEKQMPYSNIKLLKNPDHVQFEFGKMLFRAFDFYLSGDLDTTTNLSANLGYCSKFMNLRAYYTGAIQELPLMLRGSLLSNFKFSLARDFVSVTQQIDFKEHKFLLGTENRLETSRATAFFVQDYWEVYPLLYLVPSVRYDKEFHPKISVGYVPQLNTTIFSGLTQNQVNIGIRAFNSSVNFYSMFNENRQEIETRLTTPWLWDFKLTTIFALSIMSDSQAVQLSEDYSTVIAEYRKEFKDGKLGLYILGDLLTETVRFEFQLIDTRIYFRLNPEIISYGFTWHFWN